MSDLADIIIAIATLVTSIGAVYLGVKNASKLHTQEVKLDVVKEQTDGINVAQMALSRKLGVAEGAADEKERGIVKAEQVAQGVALGIEIGKSAPPAVHEEP